MGRHRKAPSEPKTKRHADRFKTWLRCASRLDLDTTYVRALKTYNAYQKEAIVAELRRRELEGCI